jgi:transposase
MNERTRFLGLDVHKATIAVAVAEEALPPESHGVIPNDPSAIRKLIGRLGGPEVRLVAAYEAGPTGYVLHRQLTALGVECMVVAPSLVPIRSGDRVKTDRRDALKLARLLRSGDLTPIWIPDQEHEALRDLIRARADAKADLLRAKHRLSKFLLRKGQHAPHGVRSWSVRFTAWLARIAFDEPAAQAVFEDYRAQVQAGEERVRRLENALQTTAIPARHLRVVAALQAFRGIGFLTAVTIVAEAGDLRRFATAPQFMAYVGVVPSEHSSGASCHRGRITKTGNSALRHVLGEAAHHARFQPNVSGSLRQRQEGVPREVVELAWRSQRRLHDRYRRLSGRVGRPKALTAVARELAGFVWALGQQLEEAAAA